MKITRPKYDLVADYFIGVANESGSLMTNLKLQKLVYYAQAWSLVLNGKPLFDDDFQAWVHGPVLLALYNNYRHLKWNPIARDIVLDEVKDKLEGDEIAVLDEVASVYLELDAYKLEKLTHLEEPWLEARGGIPDNEPCTNTISKSTMHRYYASLV